MTKEAVNEKIKSTYDGCVGTIKKVPVYIEKGSGAITNLLKSKKTKFYIAISFFVQAIGFISVFFALWNKKKTTAGVFGALAAVGALAGSYFLVESLDEDENGKKTLFHIEKAADSDEEDDDISVEFTDEGSDDDEMVFGEED